MSQPTQRPLFQVIAADIDYPKEVDLWPKQIELRELILNDFNSQGWSFAKVGQRGGKTVLAMEIARMSQFDSMFVFDVHNPIGEHTPVHYTFCGNKIPRSLAEGKVENPFILMNEPMWMEDSFDLFNELRQYGKVLAIGSNGPQFEDKRWQQLKGHSYASWEINTRLKRDEMIPHETSPDYRTAVRDYDRF